MFVFRVGLYRCRVILVGDSCREKAYLHPAFKVGIENSLSGDIVPVLKGEGNYGLGRRVYMYVCSPHRVDFTRIICFVYGLHLAKCGTAVVPEATAHLRRFSPRGYSRASCLLSLAALPGALAAHSAAAVVQVERLPACVR